MAEYRHQVLLSGSWLVAPVWDGQFITLDAERLATLPEPQSVNLPMSPILLKIMTYGFRVGTGACSGELAADKLTERVQIRPRKSLNLYYVTV